MYSTVLICIFHYLGEPSLLWVDKYRPRSVKQIIGQQGDKSNMRKLMNWLRDWEKNRKKPVTKCKQTCKQCSAIQRDYFTVFLTLNGSINHTCTCNQIMSSTGQHLLPIIKIINNLGQCTYNELLSLILLQTSVSIYNVNIICKYSNGP